MPRTGASSACKFASTGGFRPTVMLAVGRVLHPEEIAADKTLALFSRALARDLVDVNALTERFGRGRLLDLAAEDRGFDRHHFAEALARARPPGQ